MSAGGKWVNTLVPSRPSQRKVWWGKVLIWFQETFWVRKNSWPASAAICGSAAE